MFTGLVRTVGSIASIRDGADARRLEIAGALEARDLVLGASVSVSGVCLTVIDAGQGRFAADAAFETLRVTTLGELRVGAQVNLEPALRVGDALGGHFVSGHVDGVGRLRSATDRGPARELWFDVPHELLPLVAPKGAICLDGVSLTVNAVDGTGLMVGIVPHTLAVTTLGALRPGARVNVEVDVLARHVARLVGGLGTTGTVDWALLERAGFIAAGHGSAAQGGSGS